MFSLDSILKELEKTGQNDLIAEINAITEDQTSKKGKEDETQEIPPFLVKTGNSFLHNFLDLQIEENMLTKTETREILNIIQPLENNKRQLVSFNFPKFRRTLSKTKQKHISDDVLLDFTNGDGNFNVQSFFTFLLWKKDYQTIMKQITEIASIDSNNTISTNELKTFIALKGKEIDQSQTDFFINEVYSVYVLEKFLFHFEIQENERIDLLMLMKSKLLHQMIFQKEILDTNTVSIDYVSIQYNEHFLKIAKQYGDKYLVPKSSMKNIYRSTFTDAFLDFLYEVIDTEDGMATFKGFVKFQLNLKDIYNDNAIHFFFNILDVDGDGSLSKDDIYYFFKGQMDEAHDVKVTFELYYSRFVDFLCVKSDDVTEESFKQFARRKPLDFADAVYLLIDSSLFCDFFASGSFLHFEEEEEKSLSYKQ